MKIFDKILMLFVCAVFFTACGPNRHFPVNEQKNSASTPEKPLDSSAEKIETIYRQGFDFVYVFKRKDGGKLDAEDRKFLRANSPLETNQWVVTDEDATAIAGSNYIFSPANLEALRSRFNVEDLSKPKAKESGIANTNMNNQ